MSPVFNDKFDMLMNIKRQDPPATGSNSNISTTPTASPTPSSVAPTTSAEPTTTLAPPTTTSTPLSTSATPTPTPTPTSTPTPSTSSTPVTTSSIISTTSATPTSTSTPVSITSSTPVTSNAGPTSTPATSTAVAVTTTATPVVTPTTAPTTARVSTSTSLPVSVGSRSTVIVTTSNGQPVTATVVVSPNETAASGSASKSFFQNTGAVVGVFVVVGIVAMILLVMITTVFIRRRRAKQFDLDVQEAAREAARAQAPVDEDDDYTGTSYTHGSKPMNPEQRAYGYGATNTSGWDPYARGAAPGGYEMQHRRTSTGTAPGMAGFAAGDTFARSVAADQAYGEQQGYNQGYGQPYAQGNQGYAQQGYTQDRYNTGYGQGYGHQTYNSSYNNTSSGYNNTAPQQGYALAQEQPGQSGRAPVHAQMMMPDPQSHSYNTVAAFRQSPSYGEAHPGEQVQYGHAEPADTSGQDGRYPSAPRMSEDPYGGYLPYDEPGPSSTSQAPSSNPPAYVAGPSNVPATEDRKVARQPSGKSQETRYSGDEDESDEEPTRRVLKIANE